MWVGRPSHRRGEGPCRIPAGSPVPSSRSGTGSAPAPAGTPIPACSFPPTVDAARGGPPGRRRRRRSAGAARCGGGARRMPWPRWSPTASGAGCPRRTGNRAGGSPPERDRRRERSGSSSPAFTGIVHAEGSIHSWANQLRTNDDAPIRDGEHPPSFRALASAQVSYIRCSFGAYYREPRPYRGRVAAISGSDGSKEEVLWGFAPRTTDAPPTRAADRFDIVVSTDVLSEGVNLQQARHIVNYDLPWNPMRLVQRHVRIDRIGSRCAEVFLRCIFPDRQLDELLGLEERLQLKLRQALASVGVAEVLPGGPVADISFTETRAEIERLRTEDASLFDRGGTALGVLSGEEYRQQLRAALEDELLAERIQRLPWGSGSGFVRPGGPAGFVFCARVADHPRVQFRWVEPGGPDGPASVADTLACLAQARQAQGAERVLDDAVHARAYAAWDRARADIVMHWNDAADPANLAATVAPTMQRAVELVRRARPTDMPLDEADRLVDRLQTTYPPRILRQVRQVTGSAQSAPDQVRALARLADELGLQPSSS